MRIGVIGAGRIGGGIARQLAAAGHEVLVAGREPERLAPLADEIGGRAGTPAEAVAFGEVVVLSVPSGAFDDALVVCGGQGPMFQFRDHEDVTRALVRFYEARKPTAALCHGTCALGD